MPHAVERNAWLCIHGKDEFLYFPESRRTLPVSARTLRSFLEDATFFSRWHPLPPHGAPRDFVPDVVIARRELEAVVIEREDLWHVANRIARDDTRGGRPSPGLAGDAPGRAFVCGHGLMLCPP